MGVSETVIAASIGAGATLITAIVQLLASVRAQSKFDPRPKRDRTFKSLVAIVALMLASAASGYLYAQYRNESTAKDLREMRQELTTKLLAIEATAQQLAEQRDDGPNSALVASAVTTASTIAEPNQTVAATNESTPTTKIIEATVFVPECTNACSEASAQPVPVCGVVPNDVHVEQIALYVADAVMVPSANHAAANKQFERVEAGKEFNSARFAETPVISPSNEGNTLCIEFKQWSPKARFARVDLHTRAANMIESVPVRDNAEPPAQVSAIQNGVSQVNQLN